MKLYSNLSDQELTILLKNGDQIAYTAIFERYTEVLLRHAYRLLHNRHEANDVIQDVFLTLWQKRESMEFKTSLSSYLYCSVRNRIFDMLSHEKVVVRYAQSISDFMEEGYCTTDEQIREKELAAIINKEIEALPSKMRKVFILHKKEQLSYKEIAEQLNITDKTAKQQVYNAVKTLRLKIASFGKFMFFLTLQIILNI